MADAAVPSAAPTPSIPSPADAVAARAGRLRLQAKVAGVMMMLFGAFFALNFALAARNGPTLADTYAAAPGGNVTIAFPEAPGADVTLAYRSGAPATHGRLDAAGSGTFHATNATFTLQVTHANATWTRVGFVPAGTTATARLSPTSPPQADTRLGIGVAAYRWLWLPTLAAAAVAAGGFLAYRLRGPRLALGGAFLFVLGAGLLLTLLGGTVLAVSFVGTAALCFAFIYRARAEFAPLRPRAAP